MQCPECVKEGKASRVYMGVGARTLMCEERYYDEDGLFHSHNPNGHTQAYYCTQNHNWATTNYDQCPSCNFNKGRE